jgi:hypothetical protein
MTKHEATVKLARWMDNPDLSAENILDFITGVEQDEETGEQIGLGMLPPLTKKGKYEWAPESNT